MIVDETNYMLKVIYLYDLDNTLVRSDEKLLYFYENLSHSKFLYLIDLKGYHGYDIKIWRRLGKN